MLNFDFIKKFILYRSIFYKMSKLPKKFPEYSLMYKTLNKKIKDLQIKKENTLAASMIDEIQSDIEKYQKEVNRIKSIFPENFFKKND